jgi:hypothetical protein
VAQPGARRWEDLHWLQQKTVVRHSGEEQPPKEMISWAKAGEGIGVLCHEPKVMQRTIDADIVERSAEPMDDESV